MDGHAGLIQLNHGQMRFFLLLAVLNMLEIIVVPLWKELIT
jgi:hypothetical protein